MPMACCNARPDPASSFRTGRKSTKSIQTPWPSATVARLCFTRQQARVLLIQIEPERDALGIVLKTFLAVSCINCNIELLVSFDECGRHGERVVEFGERGTLKFRADIENASCCLLDCLSLLL